MREPRADNCPFGQLSERRDVLGESGRRAGLRDVARLVGTNDPTTVNVGGDESDPAGEQANEKG